jgi:hypothetical protein
MSQCMTTAFCLLASPGCADLPKLSFSVPLANALRRSGLPDAMPALTEAQRLASRAAAHTKLQEGHRHAKEHGLSIVVGTKHKFMCANMAHFVSQIFLDSFRNSRDETVGRRDITYDGEQFFEPFQNVDAIAAYYALSRTFKEKENPTRNSEAITLQKTLRDSRNPRKFLKLF